MSAKLIWQHYRQALDKEWEKFPDNDFLMVYEFYVRLYDVDIKVKSNFLPNPNLTRKIEFESKEVQIVEPEIF